MKLRLGFVSNSSSSSFFICYQGVLTPEKYAKALGIVEGSFVAQAILPGESLEPTSTLKELLENWGFDKKELDDFTEDLGNLKEIVKLLQKGWNLYEGDFEHNGEFGYVKWGGYSSDKSVYFLADGD